MEVFWEKPFETSLDLMSHYQLFLNHISYKQRIRSDASSVMVKGLCGGRSYEISLMVFPKSQSYLPQQSNIVVNIFFSNYFLFTNKQKIYHLSRLFVVHQLQKIMARLFL
jgi:hypothetical protein